MVDPEKLNRSILAVHDLIIRARLLAYQNHSGQTLGDFLDGVEYLPALILEQEDRTDFFETYLEGICTQYGFPEIIAKFRKAG